MEISSINSLIGMQQELATSSTQVTGDDFKNILNKAIDNGDDTKLKEACDSLESYMLSMVLKQVKESMLQDDEDSLIPQGDYVDTFQEQMINAVADSMVEAGGVGLSKQLYDQIKMAYGSQMDMSNENQSAVLTTMAKVDTQL